MTKNKERYQLYPIQYHELYELYKKSRQSFWQPEEVILTKDVLEWDQLDQDTKHFISHILSFFAGMDGIIMKNIDVNFSNELKNVPEAKAFYAFLLPLHQRFHGIQGGMVVRRDSGCGLKTQVIVVSTIKNMFFSVVVLIQTQCT